MRDEDTVWVAEPAFQRKPFSMAYHEPSDRTDPEYGRLALCLYAHEWVEVRRDVADRFTRPCKPCFSRVRAIARRDALRGTSAVGTAVLETPAVSEPPE